MIVLAKVAYLIIHFETFTAKIISMIFSSNVFTRNALLSPGDVVCWWFSGTGQLNRAFIVYSLLHLALVLFASDNGFVIFTLPLIFFVWFLVNTILVLGPISELLLRFEFKVKLKYDYYAPLSKMVLSGTCAGITLTSSVLYIFEYL
jgi:hypothetical protein